MVASIPPNPGEFVEAAAAEIAKHPMNEDILLGLAAEIAKHPMNEDILLGRIWTHQGRRDKELVADLTAGFAVLWEISRRPKRFSCTFGPRPWRPTLFSCTNKCSSVKANMEGGARVRERESRYPPFAGAGKPVPPDATGPCDLA